MRKILSAFVVWGMEGPWEEGLSPASNGQNAPLALKAWNSQHLSSNADQALPSQQQDHHSVTISPAIPTSANSADAVGSGFFPKPPDESQAQLIS